MREGKTFTVKWTNAAEGTHGYRGEFGTKAQAEAYARQKAGLSKKHVTYEVFTGSPKKPGLTLGAIKGESLHDLVAELRERVDIDEVASIAHHIKSAFHKLKAKLKHKKIPVGHSPPKFHPKASSRLWKPGRSREIARNMARPW